MTRKLPDCMMPDGAEPCLGYRQLERELASLPDTIRSSTWKTPELRESAAVLVAAILRDSVTHTSQASALSAIATRKGEDHG